MNDEPKPDPRLVAALRHAPDADVQAPPEVTARVMAAARAAVAPPPPRWRLAWPKPWALGASGAFATVVMAGFIALLWRGEPPVEPVVATAPAPASAPAPVAAEPARMPTAAPAVEQRRAAPPPNTLAKDARKAESDAAERARRQLAHAELARQQSADAAPPAEDARRQSAGVAAPAAAPPAPVTPAAAPPAPAMPAAAQPAPAMPVATPSAPAAPAAAPAVPQALAEKAPPVVAAAAPPGPSRSASLAHAFAPSGGAQQPLAWEVDGRVPAPADLAWLRELDRVALPHWRWGDEVEAPPDARRIRLSGIGGRAALVVTERFVQWCSESGETRRCRQATLDPGDAKRLIEMLPKP